MQSMLSGLRVVSREEATSKREHKGDHKIEESRQSSRKHSKEKKRRGRKHSKKTGSRRHSSTSDSSRGFSDSDGCRDKKISKSQRGRRSKKGRYSDPSSSSSSSDTDSDELVGKPSPLSGIRGVNNEETRMEASAAARKAAGLDWMVQAPPSSMKNAVIEMTPEVQNEEVQVNPKELNPFLRDGEASGSFGLQNLDKRNRLQAPVVGDGGLSWRLKALRRAKEQAEREGRKLDMVVEERWGSLADMTVSVSSKRAAHAHAHLHAMRDRKRIDSLKPEEKEKESLGGEGKAQDTVAEKDRDIERITTGSRDYLKDVSSRSIKMKAPQAIDSLSWKRRKGGSGQSMRAEDKEIFHAAASALNQFQNDGTFFQTFNEKQEQQGVAIDQAHKMTPDHQQQIERSVSSAADLMSSAQSLSTESMSANQLAAKALQLRLRGKTKEADELLNQLQKRKNEEEEIPVQCQANTETRTKHQEHHTGYKQSLKSIVGEFNHRLEKNNSGDAGLAESILHNKQYNRLTCVDDEYESVSGSFKEVGSMKAQKKASKGRGMQGKEASQAIQAHKRIITQEERCHFCFNNPSRPKHLTISIANSTYLMLPPREPLVDGHCFLVPTQHESSSRNVDEDVWEELRNYKKCLLQMFAKQDKDVLFMETVINLAQQRRHCLIECIPLPPNVAKQAPLYFKKAIDEAEDEWSQHNAKKLIDTSEKGLRGCIPKNFPYFHVEFGLRAGYVHVIDNERDFKTDFGRNVVIGMLKLPEEEMHRRRKQQSYDQQKKAAVDFQKAWDPYDWTKMLD
eukprot:c20417_g1_i1 orf=100-2475(+)